MSKTGGRRDWRVLFNTTCITCICILVCPSILSSSLSSDLAGLGPVGFPYHSSQRGTLATSRSTKHTSTASTPSPSFSRSGTHTYIDERMATLLIESPVSTYSCGLLCICFQQEDRQDSFFLIPPLPAGMPCVAILYARLIDIEGKDRGIMSLIVPLHDGKNMTPGVNFMYAVFSPACPLQSLIHIF